MALVKPLLQAGILAVFKRFDLSPSLIAADLASAYQNYANAAQSPVGTPMILTQSEKLKIQTLLNSVLNSFSQTNLSLVQAWVNGVTQFWLAPPVQTTAPSATGQVTSVIGIPIGLSQVAAINEDSQESAASSLADALDILTRTVQVTFTPPPPIGPPPGFII